MFFFKHIFGSAVDDSSIKILTAKKKTAQHCKTTTRQDNLISRDFNKFNNLKLEISSRTISLRVIECGLG